MEYDFLRDNEVLVTIEHCDQCQDHNEKTHHDAQKYAAFASHVKMAILSRYSMVKVLVKPLSALDGKGAYVRMGCFEVQVCSKVKGAVKKEVLHSKLATLHWPDTEEVLKKLADYLPTCQLFITVYDETANQAATLKGLKVIVRPKATMLAPLDFTKSRPQSAYPASSRTQRPKSASSTLSRQSHFTSRSSMKTGPAPLPISQSLPKPHKPKIEKRLYEQLTDREGCCTFQNIPMDNYEVEVCESKEYAKTIKPLNTLEEGQGAASFNMYVGVKPRGVASVTVKLSDKALNTLVPNAHVRLISTRNDIFSLPEASRGVYMSEVVHGEYSLLVTVAGYQDIKRVMLIEQPDVIHVEDLREKEQRRIVVTAYDVLTGVAMSGVHLNLRMNQSRLGLEGLTKQEGEYVFATEDTGLVSLEASKPKYLTAYLEQSVAHRNDFLMNVGLAEVTSEEVSVVVVHWNQHSDDVEFQVETPGGTQNYKNPESAFCVIHDHIRSNGVSCAIVPASCKAWVRLRIEILAAEYTQAEGFPTMLQNTGLTVCVYHNNKLLATATPPAMSGRIWEVGALNASLGEYVELNLILPDKMPTYEDRINDFIEVAEWVRLSPPPLATLFCFEQSGVLKNTETGREKVVSCEILKRAFANTLHFRLEDSPDLILAGIKNTQGSVSLSSVKKRYDRYKREGRNTLFKAQTIENYARLLGMDPLVDAEFLFLAEEGLKAPLPEPWEAIYDQKGELKYRNKLTGDIVSDHPNDALYREKFIQAKQTKMAAQTIVEAPKDMEASDDSGAFKSAEECIGLIETQVSAIQLRSLQTGQPAYDMMQLEEYAKEQMEQMDVLAGAEDKPDAMREQAVQLGVRLQEGLKQLLSLSAHLAPPLKHSSSSSSSSSSHSRKSDVEVV